MNSSMRSLIAPAVIAAIIGISTVVEAGEPGRPLRVFCTSEEHPSAFVDQRVQGVRDSLEDVKRALSKKGKWIELQEGPEGADIVVRLVSRGIEPTGEFRVSTNTRNVRGRTRTTTIRSHEVHRYVVRGFLVVGDYKTDLLGVVLDTYLLGGPWRTAAGSLADQVERWIKANYVRINTGKTATAR
jgi:hypothetical protein